MSNYTIIYAKCIIVYTLCYIYYAIYSMLYKVLLYTLCYINCIILLNKSDSFSYIEKLSVRHPTMFFSSNCPGYPQMHKEK